MSFNHKYFQRVSYGGMGGNSIYHYYAHRCSSDIGGETKFDNLGTGTLATIYPGFFSRAFTENGISAKAGDIIFVTTGTRIATLVVNDDWDANGASFIIAVTS